LAGKLLILYRGSDSLKCATFAGGYWGLAKEKPEAGTWRG